MKQITKTESAGLSQNGSCSESLRRGVLRLPWLLDRPISPRLRLERWLSVAAMFMLCLVPARAALNVSAANFESLGNFTQGSVYRVTFTMAPGNLGRMILFNPGTSPTEFYTDETWGAPGFNGALSRTFIWVVPPGQTKSLRGQAWEWGGTPGAYFEGSWGVFYGDYTRTGVAGPTPYVGTVKKVNVKYFNSSSVPVEIQLLKNGTPITGGTYTVAPGTLFSQTISPANEADTYSVIERVHSYVVSADGSQTWSASPGAVTVVSTTPIPTDKLEDENVPDGPSNTVTVPSGNGPSAAKNPSSGAVWHSSGTGTDGVTNAVFREGIDKITTRQDTQIAEEKKKTDAETAAKAEAQAEMAKQSSRATENYNAAKTAIENALGTTAVTTSANPGTSSGSIFAIPVQGQTINIAPWAGDGLHNLAGAMIKAFITVLLVVGFAMFFHKEISTNFRALAVAPQSRGNTVAGTGGQISGAFAAGLITVIILATPVALAALADNGLGWKTTSDIFGVLVSTGGIVGQGSLDLLGHYFPVATFISVITQTFFVRTAGLAIFGAATIAIRWIVPAIAVLLALASEPDAYADIRFVNTTPGTVQVRPVSAADFISVPTGTAASVPQDPGSVFEGYLADSSGFTFEAVDQSNVMLRPDGAVQVAVPSRQWVNMVVWGFSFQLVLELFGMGWRLFTRATGSAETP